MCNSNKYNALFFFLLWFLPTWLFSSNPVLSPEEERFLKQNPLVHLAVDFGNPPMNYLNSKSEMSGISIDYIELIAEKLDIKVKYHGSTWPIAWDKAIQYQVDGLVNATKKDERLAWFNFSDPYFVSPLAFVTAENHSTTTSLKEMQGWRIAVIKDTIRVDLIKEIVDDVQLVEVETIEEGYKKIIEGSADAMFDDMVVLNHLIQKYLFANLNISFLYYAGELGESRIAFRKDQPIWTEVFNKAIQSISSQERLAIQKKWMENIDKVAFAQKIELSAEEVTWLKQNPLVKVYADPSYAPYNFKLNSELQGYSIEVMENIAQGVGVDLEWVTDRPFYEGLELLKKGEVDVVVSASPVKNRRSYMSFTRAYVSTPNIIYSGKDIPYLLDPSDIGDYSIALIANTAVDTLAINYTKQEKIHYVNNPVEGLQLVNRKKIDLYIDDVMVVNHYINYYQLKNLKVVGEFDSYKQKTLGVSRNKPELYSILNKALDSYPTTRLEDSLSRWSEVTLIRQIPWKAIVPFLLLLAMVIVIIIIWNRILIKEILKRKNAENALRQNQRELIRSERLSAVGNLVMGVAHELNTPLGVCITASSYAKGQWDILHSPQSSEKEKESAKTDIEESQKLIKNNLKKMDTIVKTFKELSMEAQADSLTEYPLKSFFTTLVSNVRKKFPDVQFELLLKMSDDALILTYRGVLYQIFQNLIVNSIMHGFIDANNKSNKMVVNFWEDESHYFLNFSDNGKGLSDEVLPRIFEPFFTTQKHQGKVGLGLHFVMRITHELLRGKIDVHREGSRGLLFSFSFPKLERKT